jgi:hypothetical protein
MVVVPYDSPERWIVRSGGKNYLCEVTAFEGNGRCNCQNFQIHLHASVQAGERSRCKHLKKLFFVTRGEGEDPDIQDLPTVAITRP